MLRLEKRVSGYERRRKWPNSSVCRMNTKGSLQNILQTANKMLSTSPINNQRKQSLLELLNVTFAPITLVAGVNKYYCTLS